MSSTDENMNRREIKGEEKILPRTYRSHGTEANERTSQDVTVQWWTLIK